MSRIFIGVMLVLLGIIYLLGGVGLIETTNVLQYFWPSILIIIGATRIIETKRVNFFDIGIMFVGFILLLEKFNVIKNINIWKVIWPAVLIFFGLHFIFPKKKADNNVSGSISKDNYIEAYALFSGSNIRFTTKELKSGSLTALFGAFEIDFSDADIKENETATIDISALFGAAEITVPSSWNVIIQGTPIFGGWENKANNAGNNKTLLINATVLFGGLEIKVK